MKLLRWHDRTEALAMTKTTRRFLESHNTEWLLFVVSVGSELGDLRVLTVLITLFDRRHNDGGVFKDIDSQ